MRRTLAIVLTLAATASAARAQEAAPTASTDEPAIRARSEALVAAINAGQADEAAAMCLPEAELVDEAGNLHHGRDEIAALIRAFHESFPGATFAQEIERVRVIAPGLALEDGARTVTAEDGAAATQSRYVTIWSRAGDDGPWLVATSRHYDEDLPPTPHERLLPLAWLVGEWVDESHDAAISLSCRWSDDQNYLLREITVTVAGGPYLNTEQRIGWDPLTRKIKSWAFDSDGSHAEGLWTEVEGRWVVKTIGVSPDGATASATMVYEPLDDDSFLMQGLDRIVGDDSAPDFEAVIVRRPPPPGGSE